MSDAHDVFVITMLDFFTEEDIEYAWTLQHFTLAVQHLRTRQRIKHRFSIMEMKKLMCKALQIPDEDVAWDTVAAKWNIAHTVDKT